VKKLQRRCGTCKHWQCGLNKAGNRKITHFSEYCSAPPPYNLQEMKTKLASFFGVGCNRMMVANEGTDCESWEAWR